MTHAFRRVALGLVAALLATGALSSCTSGQGTTGSSGGTSSGGDAATSADGSTEAADPNRVLDYWVWQDDATDPSWPDMAAAFNAQSTIGTVQLTTIPLAQYEDKLLNGLASGAGPDAARFRDLWLGEFVKAGALENLDDYIASWDGADDVPDALYDTGKVPGDDSVYMLPHQYVTYWMYYRKSIFQAAGLDAPKTHEDVIHAAEVLKEKGQYALDVRGGSGGQDQWSAWLLSGGAEFADASGEITLADTGTDVNQDYIDFVANGYAPPGSATADLAAVKSNFLSGTTAMMFHTQGSYNQMKQALGDDLGVVAMPNVDPDNPKTLGVMSGNVVFGDSEQKDLAWAWISFLDSHDPMLELSTSVQGQLPVISSVLDEPQFQDANLKIGIEAESYAQTWPLYPGASTLANKVWGPTMQSAFEGKTTSREALEELGAALKGD